MTAGAPAGGMVAGLVSAAVVGCLLARGTRRSRRRLHRLAAPVARRGRWWLRHPWRATVLAGAVGGVAGQFAGGPVAALLACLYGAAAVRWRCARQATRLRADARRRAGDAVSSLAADLRAGLALGAVRLPRGDMDGDPWTERSVRSVEAKIVAACRLAADAGTPLADLLDRLDADLRSLARARAQAQAQAAGAHATALLLAALPVVGILLGYGVGADPLRVLLHTPAGAACAIAAIVLQLTGLLWAERLVTSIGGRG